MPTAQSALGDAAWALQRADIGVALLVFVAAWVGYGTLALRLAAGHFLEFDNLAFDFDASKVLALLTASPPEVLGFKHPLMLLLRPLGLVLMALGLQANTAAGLVMAGTGAATLALVFLFLRAAAIARPAALALSALFAVTGTQVMTAMIAETYGFAGFSLVLVWLITQLRRHLPGRFGISRYGAAIMAAGVTITNVIQPFIAELLVILCGRGWRSVIAGMFVFGVVFSLAFSAIAIAVWPFEIWGALHDPVGTLKAVWWLQTKGSTTGLLKVLQTFLGFSFVSPEYSVVPLPESTEMLDFRVWSFAGHGGITAAFWLGFWAVGTLAGLAHRGYRPIAVAMGIALLLNVIFHLGFQFRGSIYIYAAHTHFLAFALAAGLAPWTMRRKWSGRAYVGLVLALAIAVAAVNIPIAAEFTTLFDTPDRHCPERCPGG